MRNIIKLLLYISVLTFLIMPYSVTAASNNIESIFYLPKFNEEKGIESIQKNADKIDIFAPQFYVVNADFSVSGGIDNNLKSIITQYHLKVMPLIANSGFKKELMNRLLSSPQGQDNVINFLITEAKRENFIGWQFDFENMNYQNRDLYSAFVEKAANMLHAQGLILSVAAIARSVDFEATNAYKNWSGVYDYQRIARSADFISIMTYDDPNSLGPASSVPFVNTILDYVKDKIPAGKLSLGIPLYYWKWNINRNAKVGVGTYKSLIAIRSRIRYYLGFDENLGTPWIAYVYKNKSYKVWFEDKKSFGIKLDMVKNNHLRGFSAWMLGGEDPEIWSML